MSMLLSAVIVICLFLMGTIVAPVMAATPETNNNKIMMRLSQTGTAIIDGKKYELQLAVSNFSLDKSSGKFLSSGISGTLTVLAKGNEPGSKPSIIKSVELKSISLKTTKPKQLEIASKFKKEPGTLSSKLLFSDSLTSVKFKEDSGAGQLNLKKQSLKGSNSLKVSIGKGATLTKYDTLRTSFGFIEYITATALTQEKKPSKEAQDKSLQKDNAVADYTLMVYMVGADLESEDYLASEDIDEMTAVGSSSKVNVVIQTGGAANATIDDQRKIDFTKVQRHKILKGKVDTVQNLGKQNMGNSDTLADFVIWAKTKYPANRYAIILWDHGNGVGGFGFDDIHKDSLSLQELNAAFAKSYSGSKLELVGFDGCLMGTLEVAGRLKSYAKYFVASQDLEPSWGWDYSAIVSSLSTTDLTGDVLGKIIVDSYFAHVKEKSATYPDIEIDSGLTLSVLDLAKISAVELAASKVGDSINYDMEKQVRAVSLAKAIHRSERYGQGATIDSGHVDLYTLAENLKIDFGIPHHLNALESSVADAVIYNRHGSAKPDAHGLSIFLYQDSLAEESGGYSTVLVNGWAEAISKQKRLLREDTIAPEYDLRQSGKSIFGRITGSDLASLYLVVWKGSPDFEASVEIVSLEQLSSSIISSSGEIDYRWSGRVISLCSGQDQCIPTWVYAGNEGTPKVLFFPATIESKDYLGQATLIYEQTVSGKFVFMGGWPGVDENENAVRELVPIVEGDKISTLSIRYDGDLSKEIERGPIQVGKEFGPAYVEYSGKYYLTFLTCDFSDNCNSSSAYEFLVN